MIAVADASPLCYLVLIGEVDLLEHLFSEIRVPRAVILELLHADAPALVRHWADNPPAWVFVQDIAGPVLPGMEHLQIGERAAIALAESIGADIILIDEKAARAVAVRRGLAVTGLLGLLGEAASQGRLDFSAAVLRLRRTSFRCSAPLLKSALERFA